MSTVSADRAHDFGRSLTEAVSETVINPLITEAVDNVPHGSPIAERVD